MLRRRARRDRGALPVELREGVFRRAWRDTRTMAGHFWRFQLPAGLLTALFAAAGALLPTDARPLLRAGTAVLSVFGGILLIGLFAFFASLVLAPIRQRDEARAMARDRDEPVTDRLALLRTVYHRGKRYQSRVASMESEEAREDAACEWGREVFDVVARHFPGYEERFYGYQPLDAFNGSLFLIACKEELRQSGPDNYIARRLHYLRQLLQQFDKGA